MASQLSTIGTVGKIPIRNIWLLMLYASKLYRELYSIGNYDIENNPDDIPNLAAEILSRAVERRIRRNLSSDFQRRHKDLHRARGRIDAFRTECRKLQQQGRVSCWFEELTTDSLTNRFVKAALLKLTKLVTDQHLKRRCVLAARSLEMAGVSDEANPSLFSRAARIGAVNWKRNSEDQRMLAAAELAFNLSTPTENTGLYRLPLPDRDEIWARRLFEAAVGGFYEVVLGPKGWTVRTGSRLRWQATFPTDGIANILPSMKTDIILEHYESVHQSSLTRTIVDTKFTQVLGSGQYRQYSLDSGYIYQIYAYLRSQERDNDHCSLNCSGLLLHPSVEECIDESVTIQGHRIRFATVDLSEDSATIRNRLLDVIDAFVQAESY